MTLDVLLKETFRKVHSTFPKRSKHIIDMFERKYYIKHYDEYRCAVMNGEVNTYDIRKYTVLKRFCDLYKSRGNQ